MTGGTGDSLYPIWGVRKRRPKELLSVFVNKVLLVSCFMVSKCACPPTHTVIGDMKELQVSFFFKSTFIWGASQVVQWKNLPIQETQDWSLDREDPLEEEMATHSSILTWITPWTGEPSRLQTLGLQRVGHYWAQALTNLLLLFLKSSLAGRALHCDLKA